MRTHYCRNCGSPLRGAFCHSCGQKDDDYRRPLLTLSNEFLGDVFQWDSRVLRSIIPFLVMPGTLTRAYMRGRRQQYISPLRLYLVISIVFFIALGFSNRAIFGFAGPEPRNLLEDFPNIAADLENVPPEFYAYTPDEDLFGRQSSFAMFIDPETMIAAPAFPIERFEEFFAGSESGQRSFGQIRPFLIGYNQAMADPRIFNDVMHDGVPLLMVVLVPIFALIMGGLYVRRRVWFIDHLVFSLHYHSFLFAVLLLMLGLARFTDMTFQGLGAIAFFLALMGIYLYVAMLRTYRGGIFKTGIKFMILGSVYLNVFAVALFLYTAFKLSQLTSGS